MSQIPDVVCQHKTILFTLVNLFIQHAKITKGSLYAKKSMLCTSLFGPRGFQKSVFSDGLIRQLRVVSAYQAHSMYQRRVDKVMCTKYQIVELVKESLSIYCDE